MRIDLLIYTPEGGWFAIIDDEFQRVDDIGKLPRKLLREAQRTLNGDKRLRMVKTHNDIRALDEDL